MVFKLKFLRVSSYTMHVKFMYHWSINATVLHIWSKHNLYFIIFCIRVFALGFKTKIIIKLRYLLNIRYSIFSFFIFFFDEMVTVFQSKNKYGQGHFFSYWVRLFSAVKDRKGTYAINKYILDRYFFYLIDKFNVN